ncbi:MAG: DUF4317 domain-containing protein [Lachnospiraceae bacterium]|nr:DUF4317 domain-containing protein [Lachnospiraceae bacterium]
MNKSEVSEIKKQFEIDNCTVERICTCYVGSEKEKKFVSRDAFFSLPEEEMHKYLAFFKKALTGTIGKNLMNLEFPLSEEAEGGKQEFFMKLRDSNLSDDDLLDEFYDRIIANYETAEKYCILLVFATYDIPGKTLDGLEMEDASENMYSYLLCCICPVELSQGVLGYDTENNRIGELDRDWVVQNPDKGFLFPSFADRTGDVHEVLYYTRKAEDVQPDFIEQVFGAEAPLSAGDQVDTFNMLLSEVMGEEANVEVMKNIHDNLTEFVEDNKMNPEPLSIGRPEVKKLLERSGISSEQMADFDDKYEEIAGDSAEIMVTNLPGVKKFDISTPDIQIHVKPEYVERIEARVIDGRDCLVIVVDDHVEVNGVNVKTLVRDS